MANEAKKDVEKYLDELGDLAAETTKDYMQMVWPALCEQACIPLFPRPPHDQVHAMWPFLAAAVRSEAGKLERWLFPISKQRKS